MDDPFAVPDPKPARPDPQAGHQQQGTAGDDYGVRLLVHDLSEDHTRVGPLARSAVTALALRRGLNVLQLQQALVGLEQAGIELDGDSEADAYDGRHDLDGGAVRRLSPDAPPD